MYEFSISRILIVHFIISLRSLSLILTYCLNLIFAFIHYSVFLISFFAITKSIFEYFIYVIKLIYAFIDFRAENYISVAYLLLNLN